jgi:hypothetical protein
MRKFLYSLFLLPFLAAYATAEPLPGHFYGNARAKWECYHLSPYTFHNYKLEFKAGKIVMEDMYTAAAEAKLTCNVADNIQHTDVTLEKGYFTWRFTDTVAVKAGRDDLSEIASSKLQFGSKFNGAAFSLDGEDFSITGAGLLVPERRNFYAGLFHIHGNPTPWPMLWGYSLTAWGNQATSFDETQEYLISEVTYSYSFHDNVLGQPLIFHGGYLFNHKADTARQGWHVGYVLGTEYPTFAREWNLGISYQHVDSLSIPAHDMNGIGKGIGATGVVVESIYALSNQLSLKGKLEVATLTQMHSQRQNYMELSALCRF